MGRLAPPLKSQTPLSQMTHFTLVLPVLGQAVQNGALLMLNGEAAKIEFAPAAAAAAGRALTLTHNSSEDELVCSGKIRASDVVIDGTSTTVAELIGRMVAMENEMAAVREHLALPPLSPPAPPPPPPPVPPPPSPPAPPPPPPPSPPSLCQWVTGAYLGSNRQPSPLCSGCDLATCEAKGVSSGARYIIFYAPSNECYGKIATSGLSVNTGLSYQQHQACMLW